MGHTDPGRSPVPISTLDIAPIIAAYLGFPLINVEGEEVGASRKGSQR